MMKIYIICLYILFKTIKNRILRDSRNLFQHEEEENYYIPLWVSNFWSNNYIEYESKVDRNKALVVQKYLNKIRPYLKDPINNLKKLPRGKFS